MEEDKIFELFDKHQDQWNEWDGDSISYTNFKKAINETLRLHNASHRNLKEPNRKAIDLIMLLKANYNLRYVQYPEGEDPADYPKRVLKGEGFADALKIVKDFYGG